MRATAIARSPRPSPSSSTTSHLDELKSRASDRRCSRTEYTDFVNVDEITALLDDLESDRAERTESTTNTDKFAEAICSFSNDLPNHRQPGYLFVGVTNEGVPSGVDVSDQLLQNLAAIRSDGN